MGDHARLGAAVRLGLDAGEPEPVVVLPAAGVGDEQLDARLGVARLAGVEQPQLAASRSADAARQQRREALGPLGRERAVEHVEQLLARAEVRGQRPHAPLAERGPALAEDRHVGVAEAVDRLELVADREQVVALERLEDVELEPVRVLELVDHDQREALGPALAAGGVGGEQVADAELEVLEVEPGARRPSPRRRRRRSASSRSAISIERQRARGGRRSPGGRRPTPSRYAAHGSCSSAFEPFLSSAGASAAGTGHAALARARARRPRARRAPPRAACRCRPWRGSAPRPRAPRPARPGRASGAGGRDRQHRPRLAARAQRRVRAEHDRRAARRPNAAATSTAGAPRSRRPRLERALVGVARRAAPRRPRRAPRSAGRAPRRAAASAGSARRSRGSCRSSPRRPRARAPPRRARGSAGGCAPAARPPPSR